MDISVFGSVRIFGLEKPIIQKTILSLCADMFVC